MSGTDLLFAAIADDFTGGADLAGMLYAGGVPTILMFGVPDAAPVGPVAGGAIVVALKTRSVDPAAAVEASLRTLHWLLPLQARQIQFKYCSTFDSTPRGNIGPVAEALLRALGADYTVAVPALPVNGRTQYLGHLFVHDRLLSESPLRDHPLNPMTDSNLVRWLGLQTRVPVGLVPLPVVLRGTEAIRQELRSLNQDGVGIALIDAVSSGDLDAIAAAVCDMPLITGGSGLAQSLTDIWRQRGWLPPPGRTPPAPAPEAGTLILAGSCSAATLAQLERWEASGRRILRVAEPAQVLASLPEIRNEILHRRVATLASSASPDRRNPASGAAAAFEQAFGELAVTAVQAGIISNLIVAGGETSGSVIESLHIRAARVLGIVSPGVPSLVSLDERRLRLVLKSGNFGGAGFFTEAVEHLEGLCN